MIRKDRVVFIGSENNDSAFSLNEAGYLNMPANKETFPGYFDAARRMDPDYIIIPKEFFHLIPQLRVPEKESLFDRLSDKQKEIAAKDTGVTVKSNGKER